MKRFTKKNFLLVVTIAIKSSGTKSLKWFMKEFTQGRNHISAAHAPKHFLRPHIFLHIREIFTLRPLNSELQASDLMHSSTAKKFQCGKCQKLFKLNSHLKTHNAVHEKNQLACSICLKTFSLKASLKKHTEEIHQQIKNINCSHCEAKFSRKEYLIYHTKKVHSEYTPITEKYLNCICCPKTFSKESKLKEHQRIHTGEKPIHVLFV